MAGNVLPSIGHIASRFLTGDSRHHLSYVVTTLLITSEAVEVVTCKLSWALTAGHDDV